MKKCWHLSVLLSVAASTLYAQKAVQLKVIDAITNQALQGVTVSTSNKSFTATTDRYGNVSFTAGPADSVSFTSAGYQTQTLSPSALTRVVLLSPSFANLQEIVVTGSREAQRRMEVPAAINVVSKSMINDTKATRLDMLVNKVPGVYMVDLGNEQHSMAVRQPVGTKNLFLYLVDGIPVRTVGDFNHNALIEINQASMERIEVVKGPASSLYGSEAVGGAINFITQSPPPIFTGKLQAEAGSRGYKRSDFSVGNTLKKLGIFAAGYYVNQHQADHQHNDFNKTALTLRADYTFNERLKLTTVADYIRYKTDQKGGLDSAHFYSKDYISFYRFTYRKVDALRIRSTLAKDWNANNKSSLTVFYRHSTIGQNPFYSISNIAANPLKAKGQVNEDAFASYGAVLQHTSRFDNIKAKLVSGVSVDFSPATYIANFIDVDKNAEKVYYSYTKKDSLLTHYQVDLLNTAAFMQFEYRPVPVLKVLAAARYDRLDYKFDNQLLPGAFTGAPDAKDHFDHLTPKLGVTLDIARNKGAYVNYSVGFAPPNITDLYTGVKVPVLKAAAYNNYEAGVWLSFAAKKGVAEASVYKMDGKNEIVSVRLADGSYQNQNAGRTTHKGIELSIKYAPLSDIALRFSGSFARHKYISYIEQGKDYSGHAMPQAPRFIGNSELTYKPRLVKGLRVAVEAQGLSKYYTDPQNTARYKGFIVFNARAGYTISHYEVWANCINVADKVFATTVEKSAFGTSYRPGQLRTINVGVAYNFRNL